MSVQKTYGFATSKGIAGGIYDMYHYPVDSRFNEEENALFPALSPAAMSPCLPVQARLKTSRASWSTVSTVSKIWRVSSLF